MKRKSVFILGLVMAVAASLWASTIVYSDYLVNEPALAVDQNFTLDLKTAGKNRRSIDTVAATATYAASSSTSAITFTDGGLSTGSFIVSSLTNINGAYATNYLTVSGTSTLKNSYVAINGKRLRQGYEWKTKATTTLTAVDIARIMTYIAGIDASSSVNVVYATATSKGTAANAFTLSGSTGALAANAATFSGGLAPAAITINGVTLTVGIDVSSSSVDTTTGTAQAFVTAINANTSLAAILTATRTDSTIVLTSKLVGVNAYTLSSNFSGIVASGAAMTGGTASAYTINTGTIYSPAHGFDTGLGVVYSTGTAFGITNLTNGTTYYAIGVDANNFQLATSTVNAVAGTYIVLASSSTAGPHSFTLTPQSPGGSFSMLWQVSDDNTSWTDVTASSVTFATPYTAGSTAWDLSAVNHRYLRAKTTAGTSGAWNLKIAVTGRNSN